MKRIVLAALAFLLGPAFSATAQELPKAKKYTDVSWASVTDVQFKPGIADEALDLVYEHFVPAAEAAGLEPATIVEYMTGEWDVRYVFPMSEGPSGLEWEVSPNGEKFWAAFAEQEGGAEKAQEIFGKYLEMVARSQSHIVLIRQRQ